MYKRLQQIQNDYGLITAVPCNNEKAAYRHNVPDMDNKPIVLPNGYKATKYNTEKDFKTPLENDTGNHVNYGLSLNKAPENVDWLLVCLDYDFNKSYLHTDYLEDTKKLATSLFEKVQARLNHGFVQHSRGAASNVNFHTWLKVTKEDYNELEFVQKASNDYNIKLEGIGKYGKLVEDIIEPILIPEVFSTNSEHFVRVSNYEDKDGFIHFLTTQATQEAFEESREFLIEFAKNFKNNSDLIVNVNPDVTATVELPEELKFMQSIAPLTIKDFIPEVKKVLGKKLHKPLKIRGNSIVGMPNDKHPSYFISKNGNAILSAKDKMVLQLKWSDVYGEVELVDLKTKEVLVSKQVPGLAPKRKIKTEDKILENFPIKIENNMLYYPIPNIEYNINGFKLIDEENIFYEYGKTKLSDIKDIVLERAKFYKITYIKGNRIKTLQDELDLSIGSPVYARKTFGKQHLIDSEILKELGYFINNNLLNEPVYENSDIVNYKLSPIPKDSSKIPCQTFKNRFGLKFDDLYQLIDTKPINPNVMGFRNGMFDITTGKKVVNERFDSYEDIDFPDISIKPEKQHDYSKIVAKQIPDPKLRTLFFMSAIAPLSKHRAILLLIGKKRIGKSTLTDALKRLFPLTVQEAAISRRENDLSGININTRLIISSDRKPNFKTIEDLILMIGGDGGIKTRLMYKDSLSINHSLNVIFTDNHADVSELGSPAKSRLKRFPIEDPHVDLTANTNVLDLYLKTEEQINEFIHEIFYNYYVEYKINEQLSEQYLKDNLIDVEDDPEVMLDSQLMLDTELDIDEEAFQDETVWIKPLEQYLYEKYPLQKATESEKSLKKAIRNRFSNSIGDPIKIKRINGKVYYVFYVKEILPEYKAYQDKWLADKKTAKADKKEQQNLSLYQTIMKLREEGCSDKKIQKDLHISNGRFYNIINECEEN